MMALLLTLLMACHVLVAVAQLDGRYVHEAPGYKLTYVVADSQVGLEFDVPGQAPFRDPPVYPLKGILGFFTVDFENTCEGVDYWYRGISSRLEEAEIATGDLTKLTFIYWVQPIIVAQFQGRSILFFGSYAISPGPTSEARCIPARCRRCYSRFD